MKYLFDSSSIFRAIKENKIEALNKNHTLELARYELGNILWKEYALQAKIPEQDSKMMAKTIRHTLNIMNVLDIAGYEEEILETAIQLKTTFYDASYACLAKAQGLILITEDSHLIKKTAPAIKASTLESIT